MTVILSASLVSKLFCSLVGYIIYLGFLNGKQTKRYFRRNKNLRFALLTILVVVPLFFVIFGWLLNALIVLSVVYKNMKR